MNKFTVFVLGAAAGTVAALAFAPRSGEQTRQLVMEKAESAKAWCGEMIQEAEEEDVSEDELRIKIEEARQRIVRHQNRRLR